MRTKQRTAAALMMAAAMCGSFTAIATAQDIQPAPLITEQMPVAIDSGLVSNDGDAEAVVFTQNVFIPGAAALRLEFDEVILSGLVSDGSGSYLRIRSLYDGGEQRLDARNVEQWRNTSAYFNGDEVVIEIIAQPGTGVNAIRMSEVQAQFEPFVDRSICGPTDDRLPSTDNRAARLLPIGCTGWLIDDCNKCFLTAGHCSTSDSSITVVEFNVPLSNSNGTLNHPAPEDQYAVDISSRQSNNGGGVGNDYAYFGVFPNSNTGLTPAEAYGDVYHLVTPPPVQGQDIRITGYGTTDGSVPNEWNQAQKTHTGPYFSFSGTTLSYQTDTSGGNSGSPVINEDTGEAIGIHTHGGCGSTSGNYGTGANHAGLQAFLANPQGVCLCPQIEFFFPNGLPEQVDPAGGTEILIEVLPNGDINPEPDTGVFYVNDGSGYIAIAMDQVQDNVYVATFPAMDCGTIADFYFSAETDTGETVYEPQQAPTMHYSAEVAIGVDIVLSDNFETDMGWTVEDENVDTGSWDRGVPVSGTRGDPASDYDGSGRCWVTGNTTDEDVDGGPTRLISPSLDLASMPGAAISYARWFTNDDNDADRLTVEVSNDNGTTWTLVESVAGGSSSWTQTSFLVADFVAPTANVKVRFSATDNPNDSVTEAGIDAFRVFTYICSDCPADFNGDGTVNTQDVLTFLNAWVANDDSADFNNDDNVDTQDVLAFLNAWNAGC